MSPAKSYIWEGQALHAELIYIPLLNEGTDVIRPARGVRIGEGVFEVLRCSDYNPDLETLDVPARFYRNLSARTARRWQRARCMLVQKISDGGLCQSNTPTGNDERPGASGASSTRLASAFH